MSKRQRKGKNAQRKRQRVQSKTRGKAAASMEQQHSAATREESHAELGAGVRARAQGTTWPLGVRVLVGLMAFTMLTFGGVIGYSGANDIDIVAWLTGEDVYGDKASPTNSEPAMTAGQRHAMDATRKFDGFYVVDEEAGLTLAEATSQRQSPRTAKAAAEFRESAEGSRDETLAKSKERVDARNARKQERQEAKENSAWARFAKGVGEFRDGIADLFGGTWGAITGSDRADEAAADGTGDASAMGGAVDDAASYGGDIVDSMADETQGIEADAASGYDDDANDVDSDDGTGDSDTETDAS